MAAGFQAKIADELMDTDLSRLTKVIPCGDNTIRRRFAVEYLVIPSIQYTSISHKKKDECEEVMYACLSAWKNRDVKNNRSALVDLLDSATEAENWFQKTSYDFLRGIPEAECIEQQSIGFDKDLSNEIEPLADGIKADIVDKCKIQMVPWLESERYNMEELFTPMEIELCENIPSGVNRTKVDDYNTLLAQSDEQIDDQASSTHGFWNWVLSWFTLFRQMKKTSGKPKRILVKAEPGCGKSTFVSKMAWDWATSATKYFGLVLVITLKLVRPETKLENIIIDQHPSLYSANYKPKFIQQLLEKHGNQILIILDGYDEMTKNKSIEDLIQRRKYRNVNLIVTSRFEKTDYLQRYFNTVVIILGFTYQSACQYVGKIIPNDALMHEVMTFINKANRDLWKIPIFMLFLSVLALEGFLDFSAPFYTEFHKILRYVYKSYIHRENRIFDERQMENTFFELGKLAYEYMTGKTQFVGTEQEILGIIGHDALNCGLLIRQKDRRILESPTAEYVFTFQHTVIQEVLVVVYETKSQRHLQPKMLYPSTSGQPQYLEDDMYMSKAAKMQRCNDGAPIYDEICLPDPPKPLICQRIAYDEGERLGFHKHESYMMMGMNDGKIGGTIAQMVVTRSLRNKQHVHDIKENKRILRFGASPLNRYRIFDDIPQVE